MSPDAPGGPDAAKAARAAARRERKLRAEQRYQLLETARKERRAKAREAFRDAARLPQIPKGRVLAAVVTGLVALVVVIVWAASSRGTKPLIARNCTTPGLALDRSATGNGLNITWAVTGPQAGRYELLVDGRTIATPRVADCAADGTLPPLTAGQHRVELRRDGQVVATAQLQP